MIFSLTILVEKESRPSDLQAWIVEGGIPRRAPRSRLGRNSASRTSNSISRDRKEFGSAHGGIESRRTASAFSRKRPTDFAGRNARINALAIWHYGSAIWTRRTVYDLGEEIPGFSWAAFQKSAVAVGKEFGMAEVNFVNEEHAALK